LPDPRERTMAVSELTEELGLTEAGITVFEGIDSNEQ
jgi:DNA-binding Xre family transcriptional regulator